MQRKDNESYLSYLRRITEACADKRITYVEWGDCVLGEDNTYSSDNLRKAFYVVSKMINKIDVDTTDDSVIEELETLKDEVYKERCRLQDANREKRNTLREEARFENLRELLSEIEVDNIGMANYKPRSTEENRKYAILELSDWHCGAKIDNEFNYYDIDTMVERAEIIRDKAISVCNRHGVTDLAIEINGDMIDGAIRVSSRVAQEEDTVSQIAIIVKVLADFISSMAEHVENITVYTTLGNHSRLTPSKNDCLTHENFEKLIPEWLRDKLPKNIRVISSNGKDFLKYTINGRTIMLAHGQNDKIASAIDGFVRMYKVVPDEVHLGHTHSYKDINDCDILTTVNGCLDGSDDFAITLRKVTTPSQNMIVYEEDRCIYALKAK
jgi:hypothetical protein